MPFLGNFERDAQEVISKNGNDLNGKWLVDVDSRQFVLDVIGAF
jgi:hypothetical protein